MRPSRLLRFAVVVLLWTIGASSCGAPPRQGPEPTYDPAAVKLLNFQAPNLAGGILRGRRYVRRDVAFWFWAPW